MLFELYLQIFDEMAEHGIAISLVLKQVRQLFDEHRIQFDEVPS
jgi:hypothetical protein